jgi:hypothetical protein
MRKPALAPFPRSICRRSSVVFQGDSVFQGVSFKGSELLKFDDACNEMHHRISADSSVADYEFQQL